MTVAHLESPGSAFPGVGLIVLLVLALGAGLGAVVGATGRRG